MDPRRASHRSRASSTARAPAASRLRRRERGAPASSRRGRCVPAAGESVPGSERGDLRRQGPALPRRASWSPSSGAGPVVLVGQRERRLGADHRSATEGKQLSIRGDFLLSLVTHLGWQRGTGDALLRDVDLLRQPEGDEDEDGAKEKGKLIAKPL